MDVESIKQNKLFWVVVAFSALNLSALFISTVVIDKAADRVIQKLKKEYSPSPYGPGVDPDKIEPSVFGKQSASLESPLPDEEDAVPVKYIWRNQWEAERGVSPK